MLNDDDLMVELHDLLSVKECEII